MQRFFCVNLYSHHRKHIIKKSKHITFFSVANPIPADQDAAAVAANAAKAICLPTLEGINISHLYDIIYTGNQSE